MLDKAILLSLADATEARRLTAALRGTGNQVLEASSAQAAQDLLAAGAVDLALVEYLEAPDVRRMLDAAAGKVPIVALAQDSDVRRFLDAICVDEVEHLVARQAGDGAAWNLHEAVVTAEKILRNDIFGIEKYLPAYGIEMFQIEVRSASARDEVVHTVMDYLRSLGVGKELASSVAVIADELVTNAVYNAPRDTNGHAKYTAVDRREKILLAPEEWVKVRFASDGHAFTISVTDQFGSLKGTRLRQGMARCFSSANPIERKAGGAGLGLYTTLCSASQLVFNVDVGRCMEVVAVVDISKRTKGVRTGGHSFHWFERQRARSRWDAAADGAMSPVELSPAMRADLWQKYGKAARGVRGTFPTPILPKRPSDAPLRTRREPTARTIAVAEGSWHLEEHTR